jgi:hypothetical protein
MGILERDYIQESRATIRLEYFVLQSAVYESKD